MKELKIAQIVGGSIVFLDQWNLSNEIATLDDIMQRESNFSGEVILTDGIYVIDCKQKLYTKTMSRIIFDSGHNFTATMFIDNKNLNSDFISNIIENKFDDLHLCMGYLGENSLFTRNGYFCDFDIQGVYLYSNEKPYNKGEEITLRKEQRTA